MRNISFALTTRQFLDGTKTVTRRIGWKNLKAGDRLMAVRKSQGLKKGESVEKLGLIRVVDVRQEPLTRMHVEPEYGVAECALEGFPGASPEWFITFFCGSHKGCFPDTPVTRIEFRRLD